jgi:glycosyltransferase involved in cell wall biosynthesis
MAPNACGLYEAARDWLVADRLAGHDAVLVATGPVFANGTQGPPAVGQRDERGGQVIVAEGPDACLRADLLIAHTGVPDPWFSRNQAPMLWVLHGRPRACFGPEANGSPSRSFSLLPELASWPRVRGFVTLWPEHLPYWQNLLPAGKLLLAAPPAIDLSRFTPEGPVADLGTGAGRCVNILIADTPREDVDCFEVANAAVELARRCKGVRVHFLAIENPGGVWRFMFNSLARENALGKVGCRVPNPADWFRAADILLTPHRIATRTMLEAAACGCTVVADEGCRFADFTAQPFDTGAMAEALAAACERVTADAAEARRRAVASVQQCGLGAFAQRIASVYQQALYPAGAGFPPPVYPTIDTAGLLSPASAEGFDMHPSRK